MLYTQSLEALNLENAWVTIGTFDGVHLGHQAIFQRMLTGAHAVGAPVVVITFHPHPAVVVQGRTGNFYLTLPAERAAIFDQLGIDAVVMHPFDKEVAALTAADFVGLLVRYLGMKKLWVGHDFALGRKREGNVARLIELGTGLGFDVMEVDAVQRTGRPISSSLIRELLTTGDVVQAGSLLGREYQLSGEVVQGDQRGRTIGIPTANVSVPAGKLIPGSGVYACRAFVGKMAYAAAVNVGVRPTFANQSGLVHVEAHLLDYAGDLYGQSLLIDFVQKLRDEERFASREALVRQILTDIERTRQIILE
jgi:riboflavin kinase/FMN adenylyltransferase